MKKPRIETDDRRDLVAYFSGAAFARLAASSLGPALERAAREGGSKRCHGCGGVGRLDGSPEMRRKAEELAHFRRVRVAMVVSDMAAPHVTKAKIPHLTEYRRRLADASTSEPDLSAARAYAEEHREELLAEIRQERHRGKKFRIALGKRRNRRSREASGHLLEWRRLMAEGVAAVPTFAAAEQYRREHAAEITAELLLESRELGDLEVDALQVEIDAVRKGEKSDPLSTWCPVCGGRGIVGCETHEIETVEDPVWIDAHPESHWTGCSWIRAVAGADQQAEREAVRASGKVHVHETRVALGVDLGESEIERLGRVGARLSRVARRGERLVWALHPGDVRATIDELPATADDGTQPPPPEFRVLAPVDLVAALSAMMQPGAAAGASSLLSMVPAGQALVGPHRARWRLEPTYAQATDQRGGREPTDDQVLDRVRAEQRTSPSIRIGSLLQDARAQAEELVAIAVDAWTGAGSGRRHRAEAQRPRRARIRAPRREDVAEVAALVRRALEWEASQ